MARMAKQPVVPKSVRRNITLGRPLEHELKREAAKRDISFGAMVRTALSEWLAKLGAK